MIYSSSKGDYLTHHGQELTFVSGSPPSYRDMKVRLDVGGPSVEVEVRLNGARRTEKGHYICRGTVMGGAALPENPQVPAGAREYLRGAQRIPCRLRALSPELPSYKALSVNVSRTGVQLEVEAPLEPGKILPLTLDLDLPGQNPVPCRGKVAWCQRAESGIYMVGMEFVELDESVPQLLDDYALWMAGSGLKPKACKLGEASQERADSREPVEETVEFEYRPPAGRLSELTVENGDAGIVVAWGAQPGNTAMAGKRFRLTFPQVCLIRDHRGLEGAAFDDAVEFENSPLIQAVRRRQPVPLGERPPLFHYQFLARSGEVVFELVCSGTAKQESL